MKSIQQRILLLALVATQIVIGQDVRPRMRRMNVGADFNMMTFPKSNVFHNTISNPPPKKINPLFFKKAPEYVINVVDDSISDTEHPESALGNEEVSIFN